MTRSTAAHTPARTAARRPLGLLTAAALAGALVLTGGAANAATAPTADKAPAGLVSIGDVYPMIICKLFPRLCD